MEYKGQQHSVKNKNDAHTSCSRLVIGFRLLQSLGVSVPGDKHLKFYSLAWKIISCVFLLGLQVATTITVTLKVMMIIRGARQWWLTHAGHACAKTSGGTAPCRCCCCAWGVLVEVVGGVEVLEEVAEVVRSK